MELELAKPPIAYQKRKEAAVSWETLRYVLFFVFFGMIWLFPNPNAVSFREDPGGGREGNTLVQVVWLSMMFIGLMLSQSRWSQVRKQFDITLLLMLAWCLFTVPFAIIPDVALRRLIFTTIAIFVVIFTTGGLERPRAILWLLLTAVVVETLAKYFFVFGIPSLGRHGYDSLEPHLAGLWRGQFAHKNVAGSVCAIELIVLYAARRHVPQAYLLLLAALQVLFLVMSGSKTPLLIVLGVMVLTKFILRLQSFIPMLVTAVGTVVFINSVTVLTVANDTMRDLASKVLGDVSFTGRSEIWGMLLNYTADHPLLGAGFLSFWQIGFLSPAMQDSRSWAKTAIYGHQGYLDLVVTIGLPGLFFTLLFLVLRPPKDIAMIRNRRDPLLEMFVSFWLFGMLHNGTESNLLGRADTVWIFILIGVIGIRRLRIDQMADERTHRALHSVSDIELATDNSDAPQRPPQFRRIR